MSSGPSNNSAPLSPTLLTPDQQKAIDRLYEDNRLIVCPMGGGKTIIAATAIAELLNDKHLKRVLILTTPKIAKTVWLHEFGKWQHTENILIAETTSMTIEEREACFKREQLQVVVATFNILPWIKEKKLFDYFDGLLIDETTKLKTPGGAQFKALRPHLKKFKWRAGLTGTPVSENFEALYAQSFLIDCGESLGTRKDNFYNTYFVQKDFKGYQFELKPGADKQILDAVKNLIHVVPDYRGDLPPIKYETRNIHMPADLYDYYKTMAVDMVTSDAVSVNAAVLSGKLQQIASGFIYREDDTPKLLSNYRIYELLKLLETLPKKVIIAYWYQEDLSRIKKALPQAEELTPRNLKEQTQKWNAGDIDYLLIHPRSAGHGLQLEQGGHTLVWFTPQWSNDLWQQTNARIWRKGQKHPVTVWTLAALDSIDMLINQRVEDKNEFMRLFNQQLGR